MYIGEKKITSSTEWEALSEVNTGDKFFIQNVSDNPIRYCVLDTVPEQSVSGGRLMPFQQLAFKKVSGDLYLKNEGIEGYVVVEKVEN